MTPRSQTTTDQNKITYDIQLWQLLRSKKDIEYYTHALRIIYAMSENEHIKEAAAQFLQQQIKVRQIMNNLIERLRKSRADNETTSTHQFEQEIEIFDEIHFRLKKRYYAFVTKHFTSTQPSKGTLVA